MKLSNAVIFFILGIIMEEVLGHKLSDLSSVHGTNIENIWLTSKLL